MFLAIFNAGCSLFGIRMSEMPKYRLILNNANKEIRYYNSYIVAKTTAKGKFKDAQIDAFLILAGYIFGNNEKQQKIAMTTPVMQDPTAGKEEWVMSFMMPSVYKMEYLPIPKDKRISFEIVPSRHVAVIRYTWDGNEIRNARKANELQKWIANLKGYEPISPPMYAGYDPPWTLAFLRRNEIMIEVKKTVVL